MLSLMLALAGAYAHDQVFIQASILSIRDADLATHLDHLPALTMDDAMLVELALHHDRRARVIASPSMLTLVNRSAALELDADRHFVALRVRPTLADEGIHLDLQLDVDDEQTQRSGHLDLVVSNGTHTVAVLGDLALVLKAHLIQQDGDLEALATQKRAAATRYQQVLAALAPRNRRRAVDQLLLTERPLPHG